jgi:hypothetical protein
MNCRELSRALLPFLLATATSISFLAQTTAQEKPVILRGTWTATAGPTRVYHGVWSAQIDASAPNGARGSWGLLDGSGRVVLQGTWTAQKRAKVWQGSWSAIVTRTGDRPSSGPKFAGTWQASIDANESSTLLDMFKRTLQNSVSGTWQSGALKGQWTVKASSDQASSDQTFPKPPDGEDSR